MAPDYDLSNLQTDQASVWIRLQADVICAQIVENQAERLGLPFALGHDIVSAMTRRPPAIFKKV